MSTNVDDKKLEKPGNDEDMPDTDWTALSSSYLSSVVRPFQPLYTAVAEVVNKYIKEQKYDPATTTTETSSSKHVMSILDIGCGSGLQPTLTITSQLSQHHVSHHITACDGSKGMIELARKELAKQSQQHKQNMELFQIDITNPSSRSRLQTASYDIITSALVIMYLPNPVSILSYYHTLLRDNGMICLVVWGPRHRVPWLTGIKAVGAKLSDPKHTDDGMSPPDYPIDRDEPNSYLYGDASFLQSDLQKSGFHDIVMTPLWVSMSYDHYEHYFGFTEAFIKPEHRDQAHHMLWSFVTTYGKLSADDSTRPSDPKKPFCLPSLTWVVTANKTKK